MELTGLVKVRGGGGRKAGLSETRLARAAADEIERRHGLSVKTRKALDRAFGKRFSRGAELVKERKVRRYEFQPSGRIVWTVEGKAMEYQIIPDVPFCYCDDYYYRVMNETRGLCYHMVAQMMAEASDRFERVEMHDSDFLRMVEKWRGRGTAESK